MLGSVLDRSRRQRRTLAFALASTATATWIGLLSMAGCSDNETPGRPYPGGSCQGFCGPAPICGESCGTPCGCCACAEGSAQQRNGMDVVCKGGCFVASSGSGGSGGALDAGADVNCAVPECSDPVICNACPSACNPAPCSDGQLQTINNTLYQCVGGCYQPVAGDGG